MTTDIHGAIALAQQQGKRPDVTQVLERMQPDIAAALPKGIDPDRVTRLALTLIRQSEMAKRKGIAKTSLAECSPESFAGALLTAVALGLEPGLDGEAWLVPYGKECTFIPGYRGITKLFWQHPLARYLDAQAVYEGDQFDYELGLHPSLHHKPSLGDRGEKITHYYAAAALSTGAEKFEVMSAAEVAAVRDASPRRSNDIRDPQHWMERKTVLKQLLKIMPKSYRLQYALDADEQSGGELVRQDVPRQIASGVPIETSPERIDLATGEITTSSDPAEARPTREQLQRETAAIQQTRDEYLDEKYPQSSSGAAGEAGTDPGDDPAPGPASQSVEDQQAEVRRLSEERRQLRRSQPDPAADPRTGGDDGNSVAPEVTTGREPGPKITVPQQAEIRAEFKRLQIDDPDERMLWVHRLTDIPIGTLPALKDLRSAEADNLIADLKSFADRDDLDRSIDQHPLIT